MSGDKFFAVGFPLTFYYYYTDTYFQEGLKTDITSNFIIVYLVMNMLYAASVVYLFFKLRKKWLKFVILSLLLIVAVILWVIFLAVIGI
jgi:hypothetical protein